MLNAPRIIQEISSAENLSAALDVLVERVAEFTHADGCSIFLIDKEHGEFVLLATAGLNKKMINKLRLKLGEGLVGLIAERVESVNLADTLEHPKFCHYPELSKERYRAFLGIPIIRQGELLGVLVAQKLEPVSFSKDEEATLITLLARLVDIIEFTKALAPELNVVNGISCVPGVGIGRTVAVYPLADWESVADKIPDDVEQELNAFKAALKATRKEIVNLAKSLSPKVAQEEGALFDAYLQILDSSSLKRAVNKEIRYGNWAPGALKKVINRRVLQFKAMEDEYLRERYLDIMDLGQRILANLQAKETKSISYPKRTILVGEKITPAAIAEIPEEKLAGIISLQGSASSHMAILARALSIPTVMGISDFPLAKLENKEVIIDGYYGQIYIAPGKEIRQEFKALAMQEQELNAELSSLRGLPAETLDGYVVSLLVNTGLPIDIGHSLRVGAEGVGLYRSEVPFMLRDRFPTEEEQCVLYRQLLKVFAPRPVVMRTLDVGGDKSLSYFPVQEENPFLGWRGIRITLDHPEIFLIQIRAMLRASLDLNNLHIMLPMISNINEVEAAMILIKQAYAEVIQEGLEINMPKVGVMIEVPSAVYQAQNLAARVDFLSVGTNDLIQYMLAVDRNNSRVARLYDGLHPAILKALQQVAAAAHRERKKVSICGEIAGDPAAVILLLAMGFDSLSMSASQLLRIKWLIRKFTMGKAKALLEEIKNMDDAVDIRYHMEAALEEAGCAGLIRAGK